MTIELAIAMPALIVVAIIAVNALTFFCQCAVFDRISHEAVRVHAASPAYGQGTGQSSTLVEQDIQAVLDDSNIEVSVAYCSTGFDYDQYTATLLYYPTLFGLGLRSEVFGVAMPTLSHTTTYVIDSYKAGVIV